METKLSRHMLKVLMSFRTTIYSLLCHGFLRDIKAKPEVAMFAIYLLSERSERKIYMAYMATKGLPLYPEKIHFI